MTFVRQCKCNPATVDLDTGRCMTCGLQACPSTSDRVAALEQTVEQLKTRVTELEQHAAKQMQKEGT